MATPDAALPPSPDARVLAVGIQVYDTHDQPIPGATVCYVDEPTACATAGSDGTASLGISLAGPMRFALVGHAAGHLDTVILEDQGTLAQEGAVTLEGPIRLYSDAEAAARFGGAFTYPDAGNGYLEALYGGDALGQTISIASQPDHHAVYTDQTNQPDPSLTGLSDGKTVPARVLFGNLPPGTYDLASTGHACSASVGDGTEWAGTWGVEGSDGRFQIAAHAVTILGEVPCR